MLARPAAPDRRPPELRWLDGLLPSRPESDDERSHRRVLVGVGLCLLTLTLPWLVTLAVLEPELRAPRLVGVAGVLTVAANPLWLRHLPTRAVAWLTTVILHLIAFLVTFFTGGASGPAFVMLAGLPALTAILHGPRAAWLDGAVIVCFTVSLSLLDASVGLPHLSPPSKWPFIQVMSVSLTTTFALLALTAFIGADQRRREALVAARDAAERANQAKSRFLSTMSHELRTPMVGVLGAADLLAKRDLDPGGRQLVLVLRKAAQAQLRLIGDVLDLSRIEAGALDLESLPISVRELVDDVVTIFRPVALTKGLELAVDVDPALPSSIVGDPLRLHQILANLVNNALKFTERGSVRLRALAVAVPTPRARFEVEDTGIGIPADRLDHILEDFSQAETSTSRRFGGSGLGLAISRRLAEAMGGALAVRSTVGAGSVFTLEVPAPPAETTAAHARVTTPLPDLTPASRRLTLLLADDDPVNRLILGELLRDLGHFVVEAIDGADAIARLDAHAIDLVLLDMHMPGLDGPATVRAIRGQSGRLASVPILGLTADVTAARIEEFRRSGVDDVLTKPIDVATLQRALDRVTGESAARPAAAAPGA